MEERDRIRYETLFFCQKLDDGFLSGMYIVYTLCICVLEVMDVYEKVFDSLVDWQYEFNLYTFFVSCKFLLLIFQATMQELYL